MLFDISGNIRRNYTWQREWRIKTDELYLPIEEGTLLVPEKRSIDVLRQRFSDENYTRGLASCDPYGYGMYTPHYPTQAEAYQLEYFEK